MKKRTRPTVSVSIPLVLMIITFICSPAFSGTYHVSTSGSDLTGNGSSGNPWATITHALDNVPDDNSTILVKPGTYNGRVRLRGTFDNHATVKSETPYLARLRHTSVVVTCYYGQGITLEGFDIAHAGPGAGALVIQIQDLIGEPGGDDYVSDIVIKNNVLHDSYNNDILKINNGAGNVTVSGNMFYNQTGSDEHIDINSATDVIVEDNLFFNDFEGSGRTNNNDTSSFIVIKDSNGNYDSNLGSQRITVRRNIFFNWQGSTGSNFVLIGEDGKDYYEARDVLAENNLMLGNSSNVMRASFGVKGAANIIFRSNTVVGDLPSLAYAMRLNTEGSNLPCDNIYFYNNIWSDPTGTMGAENPSRPDDFSDTPSGETDYFEIDNNLYFNGADVIPESSSEMVNYTDDVSGVIADPLLPENSSPVIPRWDEAQQIFADGSGTIRQVFEQMVALYAVPADGSAVLGAADISNAPFDDILGDLRPTGDSECDMGAFQKTSSDTLAGDFDRDGDVDGYDLAILCDDPLLLAASIFAENFGSF
ncbi:MAG: hypothetical protein GY729_05250 [Desulfobacteraceae bacterium]|nr:hypothetical protein [Desulfobacteraceae bacterium]